jgi:hypothetical protein
VEVATSGTYPIFRSLFRMTRIRPIRPSGGVLRQVTSHRTERTRNGMHPTSGDSVIAPIPAQGIDTDNGLIDPLPACVTWRSPIAIETFNYG